MRNEIERTYRHRENDITRLQKQFPERSMSKKMHMQGNKQETDYST